MEGESGVTRSIIDEPHFSNIKEIKWKVKVVLLEVLLMNFILGISNEIKRKVKMVLFEVSLMSFTLGMSNEMKWKLKIV